MCMRLPQHQAAVMAVGHSRGWFDQRPSRHVRLPSYLQPPWAPATPAVTGMVTGGAALLEPEHEFAHLQGLWRGTYGPHGIEVR